MTKNNKNGKATWTLAFYQKKMPLSNKIIVSEVQKKIIWQLPVKNPF